jgi:acyl-CoA reductase-like NAD-dependent aldehyde dehydrogenase
LHGVADYYVREFLMAAITTLSTGPKLREYSQQLRRHSQELRNAAEEARHRAQIAVERSRERKERIGAVGQLEPEPA